MPTFLQTGILKYFMIIFPALLVFVIVYALLEKTKILGENKSVHSILAIAVAFLVILSADIVDVINFMAPWFVLIFVFLVLLLIVFKLMGATDQTLTDFITKNKGLQWILVGIGLVILIASLAHVYGERLVPVTAGEITEPSAVEPAGEVTFKENVLKILFNPLMLGVIFILLMAVFAIVLLTKEKF